MVALVLFRLRGVVLSLARMPRPGAVPVLPAGLVGRARNSAPRCLPASRRSSRCDDRIDVRGLERQRRQRSLRHAAALAVHVLDLAHQARLETLPARWPWSQAAGQLQHGEVVVAPGRCPARWSRRRTTSALLGLVEALALPPRWTAARRRTSPCRSMPVLRAGEAEGFMSWSWIRSTPISLASVVEVDVARLTMAKRVHVLGPGRRLHGCGRCGCRTGSAGSLMTVRRGALAGVQRGQRHEGLEGRARRVGAAQRAVEQRLVDRLVELLPVLASMPSTNRLGRRSAC